MNAILKLREFFYRSGLLKSTAVPALTISVGNISMGGTGKSPVSDYICALAIKNNKSLLLLSRGYGRKSTKLIYLKPNEKLLSPEEIGDEPWMIKARRPEISLLVQAKRMQKASALWQQCKSDWVLLDDAFQHWRAQRDIDIVLVDANEDLAQNAIPFGKLREPAEALRRAHIIILTRSNEVSAERLAEQKIKIEEITSQASEHSSWQRTLVPKEKPVIFTMKYAPGKLLSVHQNVMLSRDFSLTGANCILVSGIAKSASFAHSVKELGANILQEISFPDHHCIGSNEIAGVQALVKKWKEKNPIVLITEKDWARWQNNLNDFPSSTYRFLVEVEFAVGEEKKFQEKILQAQQWISTRARQ